MKKNIFYADEIDFVHSQEVEQEYGIGVESQIALLDSGKLNAFERTPGRWCPKYPSMEHDAPDPYPEEGLPVLDGERKAEYRCFWKHEIGALSKEDLKRIYFDRSQVENLSKKTREEKISGAALAKKALREHVKKQVSLGLITSKDDLKRDPYIMGLKREQGWSDSTVEDYTRGLGIPEKKRGRKPKK